MNGGIITPPFIPYILLSLSLFPLFLSFLFFSILNRIQNPFSILFLFMLGPRSSGKEVICTYILIMIEYRIKYYNVIYKNNKCKIFIIILQSH